MSDPKILRLKISRAVTPAVAAVLAFLLWSFVSGNADREEHIVRNGVVVPASVESVTNAGRNVVYVFAFQENLYRANGTNPAPPLMAGEAFNAMVLPTDPSQARPWRSVAEGEARVASIRRFGLIGAAVVIVLGALLTLGFHVDLGRAVRGETVVLSPEMLKRRRRIGFTMLGVLFACVMTYHARQMLAQGESIGALAVVVGFSGALAALAIYIGVRMQTRLAEERAQGIQGGPASRRNRIFIALAVVCAILSFLAELL